MGYIGDEVYKSMEEMMSSESKKKGGEGPSTARINPTICRVPESLRKLNPSAYTPRVVSIGPLHQNDPRHVSMQDQKLSYMHSLLHRTPKCEGDANQRLRECVDAIVKKTPDARTCYGESLKEDICSDVELAKTLLVDGCFILELLFTSNRNKEIEEITNLNMALGGIRHDLLLLENQIPFFVLQELFQLTLHKIEGLNLNLTLTQYVIQFFGDMMNFERKMTVKKNGTTETYDHILCLFHKLYEPTASNGGNPGGYPVVRYSATQLDSAGVKFKASKGEDYLLVQFRTSCLMFSWMRTLHQMVCSWLAPQTPTNSNPQRRNEVRVDIPPIESPSAEPKAVGAAEERRTSHQKPSNCFFFSWLLPEKKERDDQSSHQTSSICSRLLAQASPYNWCLFSWLFHLCSTTCLKLPKLCVCDTTESFLRNLIAYEQCCLTLRRHYITSYAFLMDTLINSKEDVELLENEGVLQNYLGANEDASNLFNNLCKEIFLGVFYFSDQWKQLNDYCNLYWPRHLASLRSTYFSNPWAIISLIGALIIFGLTTVQTVYSIKSYLFSLHPTKPA